MDALRRSRVTARSGGNKTRVTKNPVSDHARSTTTSRFRSARAGVGWQAEFGLEEANMSTRLRY